MNFEDNFQELQKVSIEEEIYIHQEYDNFIGIYTEAVPLAFCNTLKDYVDKSTLVSNDRGEVKDKRISVDSFNPEIGDELMQFVNNCLLRYTHEYPYLKGGDYVSGSVNLQKTAPTEGYHAFHSENHAWRAEGRTLAWMVYLNNVSEGGETEFLYQKRKVKPSKGTVVIWPAGFTHLHRGNPPMTDKYIATGWYQACSGLEQQFVRGSSLQ